MEIVDNSDLVCSGYIVIKITALDQVTYEKENKEQQMEKVN